MAEVVTHAPAVAREPRAKRRRRRFLLAYALLAAILAVAAAALAVILPAERETNGRSAPPWSEWRPTATGVEGAQQIADHVSQGYRLPGGRQLVAVVAGPFEIDDVEISAIAVRGAGTDGEEEFAVTRVENGIVYAMCGLGRRCSIAGEPSLERGRLVRRQALELALYTFTYDASVDTVATFLPPPGGTETSYLVLFRREDLAELLRHPLGATLPRPTPPLASGIDPFEAQTVDRVTVPRVFGYGFQQLQDGTAILVLSPPRDAAE